MTKINGYCKRIYPEGSFEEWIGVGEEEKSPWKVLESEKKGIKDLRGVRGQRCGRSSSGRSW